MQVFRRTCQVMLAAVLAFTSAAAVADVVIGGASITASGSAGGGRGASMAADGNPDTRWEADSTAAGQWLALEFAAPALVRAVRISEPRPRIRGWRIEVLGRGVWRAALSGIGIPRGKIAIPPTWAEGVRMVTTGPGDGAPAVSEFAAWGSGTSACMPQPGNSSVTVAGELDCAGLTLSQPCNRNGPIAPLFVLADGGYLRNATLIDSNVSCEGACTLENVNWRNSCASVYQQAAVVQKASSMTARDVNVIGGSAFGRFGALFQMSTAGSTLNLRQFVFSGYAESLNGYADPEVTGLRYRLDEVTLAGTLRGSVITVRLDNGDRASMRRLRIAGYRTGTPVVCNGVTIVREHMVMAEQWQSEACDVAQDDVQAAPR